MAQKKQNNQSRQGKKLEQAALALADDKGWADVSMPAVYAAAGLLVPPDATGQSLWPLVADILSSLDEAVNADVATRLGDQWRDNVFELLMTRFDMMQPHRKAYADIMPAALASACTSAPLLGRRLAAAMQEVAKTAGLPLSGPRRGVAVAALVALYLSLVETWRQDETPDLAPTMATLDKRLGWFAEFIIDR